MNGHPLGEELGETTGRPGRALLKSAHAGDTTG